MKQKTFALMAACLGLAAVLGGSLGLAAAGQRGPLVAGFNLAGGPIGDDVPPADFLSCLPAGSWNSLYIWDGTTQSWQHFFNTTGTGVPAYVNGVATGGIGTIPKFSGVVLLMNSPVASPQLKDRPSETCG